MYSEELVTSLKGELTSKGFESLTKAEEVRQFFDKKGTSLIVVNSVCGCAASSARPGILLSLESEKKPNHLATVFAGVDREAVDEARSRMMPFPPSSPSIALFKNGELVHMIERHHIEGRTAEMVTENLTSAYEEYC